MSETLPGWDTTLSRLFDYFEALPPVLNAVGPRNFRGESAVGRFQIRAVVGRLEMYVQETGSSNQQMFIVDARVMSDQSALRPFVEMERRLSSSAGADVDVSDILPALGGLRKTFSLEPNDAPLAINSSQRRQIAYLWDRAKLDADDILKLDSPFEIANGHDDEPIWRGDVLPPALGNLKPTLVVLEFAGRTTFAVKIIERIGSSIELLGKHDVELQPDLALRAELDGFADRLRALVTARTPAYEQD